MEEAPLCQLGDGSSSGGRAAKRPRRSDNDVGNGSGSDGSNGDCSGRLQLPPEIWAAVLEYLPFGSILSCGAASRSILRDATPLLTSLHIDKSSEMNLIVASRFRDVEAIHIHSLLLQETREAGTPNEWREVTVDFESISRVVPFLSRFGKLQRVFFGGNLGDNFVAAHEDFWEGEENYPHMGSREKMLQFIDGLSIGFRCGALPIHLKIFGLCCPDVTEHRGSDRQCPTCSRACKSFPLDSVAGFECMGSSASNALSGRSHYLDVCLERAEVESIIESRPGGPEILRSEERVLRLLGSARRYKIAADDGEELYFVKYQETEMEEIQRVINYANLSAKKMSSRQVSDAMMRSFASNDSGSLPPKGLCYISEESLDYLKGRVGLCFDRDEFARPLVDLAEHARQFAWVLIQRNPPNYDASYEMIEGDCLRLVRRLVEEIETSPIDGIATSVPTLDALRTLKSILAKGSYEHMMLVIDAGAISLLCGKLRSSTDGVVANAISALRVIFMSERKVDIEAFANAGAITTCIALLESDHAEIANDALIVLAAAKDHISPPAVHQLLPHLVRILKSHEHLDMLADCLDLLRHTEADNPPLAALVDPSVTSRLVHILNSAHDKAIWANAAHALLNIVAGSTDAHVAVFVEEEPGLLPLLLGLQNSPCEAIAEKAILTLHDIASSNIVGRWTSWKHDKSLSWGEFKVSGELVDFVMENDEGSNLSEAEEVSDEQVKLEEEQAAAAANPVQLDETTVDFDASYANAQESLTLLGLPNKLLAKILDLATFPPELPEVLPLERVSNVLPLERVCKRFLNIMTSGDFWSQRHKTTVALRGVREFQQRTMDEILFVLGGDTVVAETGCEVNMHRLCCKSGCAEIVRNLAADLLSKMIHAQTGPEVNFRLRGDTICFLTAIVQGHMVKKLSLALLAAVNCHRAKVQREDALLVFRKDFHSLSTLASEPEDSEGRKQPGSRSSIDFSQYLPFPSGTVWRWPEDDSCCDVLPPEAGRRIIRRLAYIAGITEMTGDAFAIAEAELLYAMGILLADAYESSVELGKTAAYLTADDLLRYRMAAVSDDVLIPSPETDKEPIRSLDMFQIPPPPFKVPRDDTLEGEGNQYDTVHTIVPGQLVKAAEQRNIGPSNVYDNGWVYTSWPGDEIKIEESYYYGTYDTDFPDSFPDSSDDEE